MEENKYTKWVACWGNATSITERTEATYARNLTLRYPIRMCFSGSALRFHFSNLTGTEPVTISHVSIAVSDGKKAIQTESLKTVSFGGSESITIQPGREVVSDEILYAVTAGMDLAVNIYLADFTQMNAGVLTQGPLSRAFYSYGNYADTEKLPEDLTRPTKWFYFMNTIDVLTEEKNRALICFGDSITAQDWPDYLSLRAWELGYRNVSIIRRAVSGTRILRQYDCITYAAYGLKGETRFPIEMNVAGADTVIIQHGINDIIHPVGTEVNQFRPWSDMPTAQDLIGGTENLYVNYAKHLGYKVWSGTLIPIYGWRTYAQFRDDVKDEFNAWLRTSDIFDGCVDFDLAIRDPEHPAAFDKGCDSGDHLHPSGLGYKRMAEAVPEELLK